MSPSSASAFCADTDVDITVDESAVKSADSIAEQAAQKAADKAVEKVIEKNVEHAAEKAPAVGEEDDLEQHGRRVGGCTGEIILVAGVEAGQIEPMIDQVVQGVFEGAGMQLPFEIDGNEALAGVYVFVAGHEPLQ